MLYVGIQKQIEMWTSLKHWKYLLTFGLIGALNTGEEEDHLEPRGNPFKNNLLNFGHHIFDGLVEMTIDQLLIGLWRARYPNIKLVSIFKYFTVATDLGENMSKGIFGQEKKCPLIFKHSHTKDAVNSKIPWSF